MCKACQIKPVYEFTNKRKLCKTCFIKYFQKKALYTIRKFKMIRKEERVGYENKGDFRGVVLENILKIYADKAMVELVRLPTRKANKKLNRIAIANTLDLEANKIVSTIIKGNVKDLDDIKPIIRDKKLKCVIVKPLYLFLDEEVLLYAKLRGLKFKKEKIKGGKIDKDSKDRVWKFINELEKKHPEVKRAIVSSYLEMFGSWD